MGMDFKTFNKIVGRIADAKHPVLIRGKHGIGKSETVYAYAKSIGKRVVERRASQMTEGDLVGLPVIDGNRTTWNPPDWYKEACEEGVVLFFDEVDRAVQEVRQGLFQLTDSRTLNGHRLHPDTLVFAAVNGGAHGAQYSVNDMDPAELDRWTAFDLEPTVEDWLQFANNRLNTYIVDFIRENPAHLEHNAEFEPNKVYPSRRSWVRFNDTVNELLTGEDHKANLTEVYNIGVGFIGFEASVSFRDFVEKYEQQVSVDNILKEGKIDLVKKFKLNDHIALADKILASGRLNANMDKGEIENVARWFLKLPSEAAMKFYSSATKNADSVHFIINFHKMTVDGKSLKSYIQDLLNTKGKKTQA